MGKGEERVHRLMTRERFPYLHDLLASTANQDEIEIWECLDARMSHWQGQNWRQDTEMTAALAAEARRFDRRYPPGDPKRQSAWWALGSDAAAEFYVGPLLLNLARIDQP